ncbi:hypothetical protein OB955_23845 [Halobacteria archaeon AArc-m2/3/4]|uniref:Uncharacterized protein n=1 Tax=Natronoglomus mannanivorans TaxID=2979990 RepID=A0ABT2QLB2_9EURY|nr:hypothetical protein [Halobacteria archaeon AArc-m2/3/4]
MTRELRVVAEFDRGTLIAATSGSEYVIQGKDHAYYVPDKARLDAGLQRVRETETTDAYRDGEVGFDWEAIRDTVSAMEIVERAEQEVMNHTGGDIGDVRRRGIRRRSRGVDDHVTVPAGVVKFADPEADEECGAVRDPVERGLLWGTLKDRVLADMRDIELQYQNDVQRSGLLTARLPLVVLRDGEETMVAYLAAHDHTNPYLARFFDLELETVQEILECYSSEGLE